MWVVTFDGTTTYLKDTVGQTYIAQLLAAPHKQSFAPDLLQAVTGEQITATSGSAGDQADGQALEEVKQQYLDLRKELDEADRNNDEATRGRIQRELDKLTNYLKQVKGFGGRTRQASDNADKIRRATTQAIGRTIESIRPELPAAAQHLTNAIKTGLFMSYEPEEELSWSL